MVFRGAHIFIFGLNSCGVSRQEFENLKTEKDKLLEELEIFKNGEPRLIALLELNVKNGDFTTARENITILSNYHPESMRKPEVIGLETIIVNEETRIARVIEERVAAERAAAIERQKGFNSTQAATARVIDVIEADFFAETRNLRNGEYVIIRPGYFDRQSGNTVYIYAERNLRGKYTTVSSNQLFRNLNSGTRVSVLIQANYGKTVLGAERCFYTLIELQISNLFLPNIHQVHVDIYWEFFRELFHFFQFHPINYLRPVALLIHQIYILLWIKYLLLPNR
jgi:hypothetical protein